jgi:uncharacterized protein (TIGR02646 family)
MKNYKDIKNKLMDKFHGHCAYCGKKLSSNIDANIEHFKPKSVYPDLEFEPSNLLLSCRECNVIKSNHFPLNESGSPLLLNPNQDDLSKHIKQSKNGILEGISERGKSMIAVLRLNRESLIEQRMLKMINMDVSKDGFIPSDEVKDVFEDSLRKVENLNSLELPEAINAERHMSAMIFANIITALETYLCDRFISIVQSNKDHLLCFVENFKDFKTQKITLSEIFKEFESIEEKAYEAIKDVLYHNLPKVSGIYCSSLNIEFPDYVDVFKAVTIRHDLVHRGGKNKNGEHHEISKKDVSELLKVVREFYGALEEEIEKILQV